MDNETNVRLCDQDSDLTFIDFKEVLHPIFWKNDPTKRKLLKHFTILILLVFFINLSMVTKWQIMKE